MPLRGRHKRYHCRHFRTNQGRNGYQHAYFTIWMNQKSNKTITEWKTEGRRSTGCFGTILCKISQFTRNSVVNHPKRSSPIFTHRQYRKVTKTESCPQKCCNSKSRRKKLKIRLRSRWNGVFIFQHFFGGKNMKAKNSKQAICRRLVILVETFFGGKFFEK
jgi:hypothetical protein